MKPLLKLSWVEMKLFLREPIAVLFSLAFPFFVLFVMNGVFGNDVDPADEENMRIWRGVGPADYYVPAYVTLVMASIGLISMPLHLADYRERGILRRFRAAGVPLAAVVGSQVAVGVAVGCVGTVGITAMSMVVYGTHLPKEWAATVAAFVLATATFASIGVLLGAVLPTTRAAQGAGLSLFFTMFLISGSGPPRGVLTSAMRAIGDLMPLSHSILTLQGPWLGQGWDASASLVVVGFFAVACVLAVRLFRWE